MREKVYTKEKKPMNVREENLTSLEEEYNHIREDWRITWGKQKEVCYVVILSHKIPVLISIISGEVHFNHRHAQRNTCSITAGQFCWSMASSIAGGQRVLP